MRRALSLIVLCLFLHSPPAAAAMTGDERAIAMARRLVELMGGAEIWSRANWIYTREDARYGARPGAIDVEFWRRIDAPGAWGRTKGPTVDRVFAWTADGGWVRTGDAVRRYSEAEMQSRLGWRRGEIYLMYARFAREDPGLRLVWKDERTFRALEAKDGADLGLFHVDSNGELARWTYGFGDDAVDYVYGPLKRFENVSMPAWGTLTSGEFRFFYTDIRLSEDAPDIDFEGPP